MIDNRTASAIDQALQKHDTPVGPLFFVTHHGRTKKCLTRKTAIRYLAFFMTTRAFERSGFRQRHPDKRFIFNGNEIWKRGESTSEQSDDCADSSPGNSIQKNGSENMTHGAPDITN